MPKLSVVDRSGGPSGQVRSRGCDPGQRDASVGGMRRSLEQPGLLEPVDDVGDAGRVDHQARPHLAERHLATPRKREEHQGL